jgi:tRNA U55 pseudouridine synthase TruB
MKFLLLYFCTIQFYNTKMIYTFQKEIGESMLQVIDRFKKQYNISKNEKVAFAGRLDPIAFGEIKLLTGDDLNKKDLMCNQNKIYTYSVIECFKTDTYDILGFILQNNILYEEKLFDIPTKIIQEYPLYSSKTVNIDGKMMRLWEAKKTGKLNSDTIIPTKDVTIFYNKIINRKEVGNIELYEIIKNRINKVDGNFRQKETLDIWEKQLNNTNIFKINSYETMISSGGYVRSIANSMGGVAFDICRKQYINI